MGNNCLPSRVLIILLIHPIDIHAGFPQKLSTSINFFSDCLYIVVVLVRFNVFHRGICLLR